MIWVRYQTRNEKVVSLEITGHAGSADPGHDLVCAGASTVAIGLCNAVDELANGQAVITVEDNLVRIEVSRNSQKLQNILNTGIVQFRTLSERYSKYVRVRKMEVKQ